MEFETVDGATWVKLDGLWQTEYGALDRCFMDQREASRVETITHSRLFWARITDPARPEYDPNNPMPLLRQRVIAEMGLPADSDAATVLEAAEAAIAGAEARMQAAEKATLDMIDLLTDYATERRVRSVETSNTKSMRAVREFAGCVEQSRMFWLLSLVLPWVDKQVEQGPAAWRARYDQTVAAWEQFRQRLSRLA
jgi:hypothetical protein